MNQPKKPKFTTYLLIFAIFYILISLFRNNANKEATTLPGDVVTLSEVSSELGFTVSLPDKEFAQDAYRIIDKQYFQATYKKTVFKKGSKDVSFDKVSGAIVETQEIDGKEVTIIKDKVNPVLQLLWSDGEYNYSISNPSGIEISKIEDYVKSFK